MVLRTVQVQCLYYLPGFPQCPRTLREPFLFCTAWIQILNGSCLTLGVGETVIFQIKHSRLLRRRVKKGRGNDSCSGKARKKHSVAAFASVCIIWSEGRGDAILLVLHGPQLMSTLMVLPAVGKEHGIKAVLLMQFPLYKEFCCLLL